jgi:hypothetical protein
MRYVLDIKDKCVRVYDDKGNEFICVDEAFLEVVECNPLANIICNARIILKAEVE